jgi:thioredoxin reductase (NADPH)
MSDSQAAATATTRHKVVVLGSGPAGLTAAIYAGRALLEPLVLEGGEPGGQLTTTTDVENYPGFADGVMGPEMIDVLKKQAERFGAEIRPGIVERAELDRWPFVLHTESGPLETETLIVATGATAKYLGLPSEQAYMGKGVSACATCDGFFFKGMPVIVVGGGDTAAEEALFLTRFATRVYLVHRRDELRASKIMQERVLANSKIEPVWDSVVEEVLGDGNNVTGARVRNIKTDEERVIEAQGFFVAIGHQPNTGFLGNQLDTDPSGYLQVHGATSMTNIPGVFAAGDVHDARYRQAITAAGAGCKAAIDAERWLEEKHAEQGH